MGKWLYENYKGVVGVIIGVIISAVGVYAAATIPSSNVSYDNSASGLTSTNMKDAIDELYEKVNNKPCQVLKGTGKDTNDEIICGTEEFYVLYSSGDSITVLTKYPIEAGGAIVENKFGEFVVTNFIENPSYAQNKNCGNTNFLCGGTGFSSEYKKVLNKIGLSDSIEVVKPSLIELNKAGCSFVLSPVYDQDNGKCEALPWLSGVVLTDTMAGPTTPVVAHYNRLEYLYTVNFVYLSVNEKLIVKIPVNDILMS